MSSEGLRKVEILVVELKTLEATVSNPWLKDKIIDMCAEVESDLESYSENVALGCDEEQACADWIEEYTR